MRSIACLVLLLTLHFVPEAARAERIVSEVSRWTSDHRRIFTEQVIENDDGSMESRRVPGGTVDGITMIQISEIGGAAVLGYVPTRGEDSGIPLHWTHSCVFITPNSTGSSHIAGTGEFDALRRATENWNDAVSSCAYVRFVYQTPEPNLEVGFDGKNTVIFREQEWCTPATDSEPKDCHAEAAVAVTSVFHYDQTGEIVDTDVEFNGVFYSMATGCETTCVTSGTAADVQDLENTMTHELGHVLGLAHTCFACRLTEPSCRPENAPLDDNGVRSPFCPTPTTVVPTEIREATMYPFTENREVSKRSLEADDIAGVCAAHPKAEDPMLCEPVTPPDGGCAVSGGGGAAWLWLLTALACIRIRRR